MIEETRQLTDKVALRRVDPAEEEAFLKQVYLSTRQADAAAWALLGEEQAKHLIEMQYLGQQQQYAQDFPDAEYFFVLFEEKPVGRLITSPSESELRGVDLAILPEYRDLGIGTVVLNDLFDEATRTNCIFTFHVLKTNLAAIRLYERLGCQVVEDTGSHLKMKRV